MSEVTRILAHVGQGSSAAGEELLLLVYDELRKLAAQRLAHEKPGQTLDATALVHEAYLRLVGSPVDTHPASSLPHWNSRGHFFAAAAEAMRRIVIENARRKHQVRRGGDRQRVPLEVAEQSLNTNSGAASRDDLMALDDSLAHLEAHDPDAARLVKLRYFVGMSMNEAADALGVSLRTAERNWTYARTWLARNLRG
jgi:RNA polymerase sigma factor (TIGR02999 family)